METNKSIAKLKAAADDFDSALEIFQEELESLKTFQADERMAKSMAIALLEDDDLIATLKDQEAMARNDRDIALAAQHQSGEDEAIGVDTNDTETTNEANENPVDISYQKNMLRLAMKENYECFVQHRSSEKTAVKHNVPHAESSAAAQKRKRHSEPSRAPVQIEEQVCVACTEGFSIFDLANLPCGHDYCRGCISKLFADSMVDESLFPPRCCRANIPVEHVKVFLHIQVADEFLERKEELETPNKVYCHVKGCSKFIPKQFIHNDIGRCVACGVSTCCLCKGTPHTETDCPEDPALQAVLETAEANGWRRCNGCSRLVELTVGCNHITCRCGAQFCYECGAEWKTCECPQWREDRLIGRARAIQQRHPDQDGGEAQLHRIAENLRVNHECRHAAWEYVTGSHECEECGDTLPQYIFQCRQCELRACWRCRRNRL